MNLIGLERDSTHGAFGKGLLHFRCMSAGSPHQSPPGSLKRTRTKAATSFGQFAPEVVACSFEIDLHCHERGERFELY